MNIPAKRPSGFTLVEVLVVLGIIALLSTILLGVFSRVRESGRRVTCQSNLKQISIVMQQYVSDYNGYYLMDVYVIGKPPNNRMVFWHDVLAPYLSSTKVFRCPSNSSINSFPTDYGYNSKRLNVYTPPFPTEDVKGIHESKLVSISTIPLNLENTWFDASGNYWNGGPPITSSCGRSFWGGTLHAKGANYSFVDGHIKWLTQHQMGEIECSNGPLPAPFND